MKKMTDQEIEALYEKACGRLDRSDPRWMKGCIAETRRAIEAKSLTEAVALLTDAGWGEPLRCATALRGATTCPACGGIGIVERKGTADA